MPDNFEGLRFPCDCVSSRRKGYSDPWTGITKNRLLPDGTKEGILNLVAQEPRTISQIAEALSLSAPSVYAHVRDMLKSELLREAVEWEKTHPAERYYEPNFPVIKEEEAEELCRLCDDLAARVADLFKKSQRKLEKAFRETPLGDRGWDFAEVAQYVFASVQRGAREILEQDGILLPPKAHRNGVEWVFWAEQPAADSDKE
ncbi:MAG TPA: winged helix-turn-helix domain-containing protein [Pyrinomonadaceae bacterium]